MTAAALAHACTHCGLPVPAGRDGDFCCAGCEVVHDAIAALFRDDRIDPLIVIRWKDVYEGLERAIDSCETAANVVANIAVKNA